MKTVSVVSISCINASFITGSFTNLYSQNFNIGTFTPTSISVVNACITNCSFQNVNYVNSITGNGPFSIINSDPSKTTISVEYMCENQMISSLPAYDTHRITFNMRYYDTMYTESNYLGVINNRINGTTNVSTLYVNGDPSTGAWNGIKNPNGNPLYIGTNNNLWLFNTYDNNASLLEFKNYCIGSTWSSTKYSFDCYGTFNAANNITIHGNSVATQSWVNSTVVQGGITSETADAAYDYNYNTWWYYQGLYFPSAGNYVVNATIQLQFTAGGTTNWSDFFLTKSLGNVCDDQYSRQYTNLAYTQTAYTTFIRLQALVHANSNSDEMYLVGQIYNTLGSTYTYKVLQPTGIKK